MIVEEYVWEIEPKFTNRGLQISKRVETKEGEIEGEAVFIMLHGDLSLLS